jgi:hypothetical protein
VSRVSFDALNNNMQSCAFLGKGQLHGIFICIYSDKLYSLITVRRLWKGMEQYGSEEMVYDDGCQAQ